MEVSEVTIEDKINYWKTKLKVGSEWLTVELDPQTILITDIEYDQESGSVVVEYITDESPHMIYFIPVDQFIDGRFIRKN